ncbi:sensor histidine kinase [Methylococcus sp. EFPC2]|uniref:sensor histidine kinase n=1 Tax=Methylococcus sp. EFPC2 TaxID=2812648 RepID=UPI001967CEA1|nr:ATP-binding protein [Methylococcus sp. EFPC2]QSA96114.1 hypothetical protein JWZ97_12825 [Methylococcus sp. EFPC2]
MVQRTQNLLEANRKLRNEMVLRQRLEHEVIQISEYERKTIGQELHDSLGQHLTGIAFLGQALAERLSGQSPGESRAAQELARLVNEAIVMTRSLARGLWQTPFEAGDLHSALDQLAKDTARRYGVQCRFFGEHGADVSDDLVAINLFRIVQEAIGNAIRHGKATQIAIELSPWGEGSYRLSVRDNGCGIAIEQMDNSSGLGLHIMEYRANVIGAAVDVQRNCEGGTHVVVTEKYWS